MMMHVLRTERQDQGEKSCAELDLLRGMECLSTDEQAIKYSGSTLLLLPCYFAPSNFMVNFLSD